MTTILVEHLTTGTQHRATKETSRQAGLEVTVYRLEDGRAYWPQEFWQEFRQLPTISQMTQERQP